MEKPGNHQVFRVIMTMTIPVILGMVITFLFQLADTYFVGMLGMEKLAAMSFTYPVYILFIGLFMGMASGVSSSVAKALGEGDQSKAGSLATVSVTVFILLGMGLGMLGLILLRPLFTSLGAEGQTLNYIQEYMGILFPGFFLRFLQVRENHSVRHRRKCYPQPKD